MGPPLLLYRREEEEEAGREFQWEDQGADDTTGEGLIVIFWGLNIAKGFLEKLEEDTSRKEEGVCFLDPLPDDLTVFFPPFFFFFFLQTTSKGQKENLSLFTVKATS